MMKKIVSAFVKYPFYGKIVIAILVFIGGIATLKMKKATFPIVESRVITVSVAYQGATPKEMEEGVTTLIEEAIRGIPGIKEFSSQSRENLSMVTIKLLTRNDIDELLIDVKNSVDGISNFPASAEKPIVSKNRTTDMAMFISLNYEDDDILRLNELANQIEDDFLASGVISQITIHGIPNKLELAVEINEEQLRRYKLTMSDVQNAISANNIDITGGAIRNSREEIKVISRNRAVDVEHIRDIVINAGKAGNSITVGDVANVTLQFEETPNASYVGSRRNVVMVINKLAEEDLEAISEFIHPYIGEFNQSHDKASMTVLMDFLEIIEGQLSILINNGLMGAILVILSLSLLLNFRLSLWVAWGIPASFLGMFILASLSGYTINIITLFGMILIIGILVDDGIVIGENIFTHYEMGKTPRRSAIDGTLEVLPAVFTSIVTTIIAFTPLFFIEGNMEIMYELAFVVVIALGFSLAEAIFVLPGHLASSGVLKPFNKKSVYSRVRHSMDRFIGRIRDRLYLPLLNIVTKYKTVSVLVVTSLFIITSGLIVGGRIPYTFFPHQPSDMFSIDLALKPGTNETFTKENLNWIDNTIWQVNDELRQEFGDTLSYVSRTMIQVGVAFNGSEIGAHAGMIRVFLNSLEDTEMSDQIIKRALSKKIGKIPEAYKFGIGASNRFGAPVAVSLQGYDLEELDLAKNDLKEELNKISSLYNIIDNSQLGSQEIHVSLKPEAYTLGLTYSSLMQQTRQAYFGGLAQRIQEGKNEIWIYVRYPLDYRKTIGKLENMKIRTQQGEYPLKQVANLEFGRSLNRINRFNGRREIQVEAYQLDPTEPVPPILDYIDTEVMPKIQKKYPGIDYMHQGQQKDSDEQMVNIITYFGIAFLIIVLIIMIYFKSFLQGIMILLMVPIGCMGAIWGHGIHGEPFSMLSLWGLVALSGTIINDAIVFLSKYNQNLVSGMKIGDAVTNAGKSRFRPIVLTTVTTTLGLMPLILETSQDAQMVIPMAISVAYGILFGTFFILIMLPVLILITNRLKMSVKRFFSKEDVTPESVEVAVINHQIDEKLKNSNENI
jgi:multidrug efflux pump subunit AcrB